MYNAIRKLLDKRKTVKHYFEIWKKGGTNMLRSIKKAYEMVRAKDPDTAITVHTIRTWCKEGKVKSLTSGNKILVDMESLFEYISLTD